MLTKSTLINLPATMPVFAGVKDTTSQYIWSTNLTSQFFGYQHVEELIGRRDTDIKQITDMASQFMQDDKTVMFSGSQIFIEKVNLCYFGLTELLTTKIPCYDETKQITGIFFNAVFMDTLPFHNLISLLNQHKDLNSSVNQIVENDPKGKLSIRELEILFFTLRGKTAKAIALNLQISVRTVETHLSNIKNKFACHNKQQLIEQATYADYMSLIPKTLIQANHSRHEQFLRET